MVSQRYVQCSEPRASLSASPSTLLWGGHLANAMFCWQKHRSPTIVGAPLLPFYQSLLLSDEDHRGLGRLTWFRTGRLQCVVPSSFLAFQMTLMSHGTGSIPWWHRDRKPAMSVSKTISFPSLTFWTSSFLFNVLYAFHSLHFGVLAMYHQKSHLPYYSSVVLTTSSRKHWLVMCLKGLCIPISQGCATPVQPPGTKSTRIFGYFLCIQSRNLFGQWTDHTSIVQSDHWLDRQPNLVLVPSK
jgi:hypothetical protein